jgi:hypothetical protein
LVVALLVQHLVILQQFLPFVRLDGYYIVSDIAGVPDLFGRVRPILASLVPGRSPSDTVTEMRPGARMVVTAWVLLTVPLLAGSLILFIVTLPGLASTVVELLRVRVAELRVALETGTEARAIVIGLQVALLAVPLVGLSVPLFRGVSRLSRSAVGGASRRRGRRGRCQEPQEGTGIGHLAGGAVALPAEDHLPHVEDDWDRSARLGAMEQLLADVARELEIRRLTGNVERMGEQEVVVRLADAEASVGVSPIGPGNFPVADRGYHSLVSRAASRESE